MPREMLYSTRDEEYKVAGWIGTVKIMQRAGEMAVGHFDTAHPRTIGHHALALCVNLYHKPQAYLELLVDRMSNEDQETLRKEMLKEIGVTKRVDAKPVLNLNFLDAMAYLTDHDLQAYASQWTDFDRLLPEIDLLADYYSTSHVPRILGNDYSAIREAQRDIDFYVGLSDSKVNKQ